MRDFNAAKDTAEAGLLSYKYTSSVNLFFTGAYFDTATFMTRWVWFLLKEKLIILSNGCLWRQAADDRRIQARERYLLHPPLCTTMHQCAPVCMHHYACTTMHHYAPLCPLCTSMHTMHYAHRYAPVCIRQYAPVSDTMHQYAQHYALCTLSMRYAVHVWLTVQSTHPQISVRPPLCKLPPMH